MATANPYLYSVVGIVIDTKRVGTSVNGNPTYCVTLSTPTEGYDGQQVFRTKSDISLAYAITNAEYRDKPHIFGLTRSGRLNGYVGPWDV